MFELRTTTECELTKFVGRTQKGGKEDVPAVSFYLKISSASNTMLDMLSPTMRLMAYAPVEGQDQLPGVEPSTPILRSTDLKHWKSETVHEGWTVILARGLNDDSALQMGSCKIDEFDFDLFQGGHCDCEFRISTADVDEAGAGMLWGRQKRKVFAIIQAPEIPKPAIDGSVESFKRDHPEFGDGQGDLLMPEGALEDSLGAAAEGDEADAGTDETGADAGESGGAGDDLDDDGSAHPDADAQREQAELEAGMAASLDAAGVAPKGRRGRKTVAVE